MEVRKVKFKPRDGETTRNPTVKVEKKPPVLQKEKVRSTRRVQVQAGPSCGDNELDRLYDNRKKTAVSPPAVVRPKESQPQPADVPCRPRDPLYVRRVGQRFWSTKRILDWQRQALRARENPEAILKPVREYGEELKFQNAENEESDRKIGHYENDEEHTARHYDNDRHYKNDEVHTARHDKNDRHYKNDEEHIARHYDNDRHCENDEEHKYFQHYENDEEHKYFQYDKNHGHYENDKEHKYFQYDKNHGHYENDEEHTARHYENDEEHTARHYENDEEHTARHYENDEEHTARHYENDEEHSNLSMHVYADLDQEFLAIQDAIQNASAEPFYEMDISPADEEQEQPFYKMDVTAAKGKDEEEQPFYKMDVTAAKGKDKQEEPFYEMDVASAGGKNEQQPFYKMEDNQLGQPTSDNVYADLDAEFVAAQDAVCMRHRARGDIRVGAEDDAPRWSKSCREFFRSRPGRVSAVCVGVIIAVTAATVVAVIFNHNNDNMVLDPTTFPPTSTTSSVHLPVTSPATSATTDWWTEWTVYIREYFQQNSDAATGLEESFPYNEVVMALLESRLFWPCVCRYWGFKKALPHTLSGAVAFCIPHGTSSEYMESHGFSTYAEFFSAMLDALEGLPNMTKPLQNVKYTPYLSLSIRALSYNDVEALVKLFPYMRDIHTLHLSRCGLSAKAAALMAKQLHLLHALKGLIIQSNNIGDDGVKAISETFPHLKELRTLNIGKNSITNAGGRAMAKKLGHLQELQNLYLTGNKLALSLSSLAKAFVNMARLEIVRMWPTPCRTASFRMVAQQVRDVADTLEGKVRSNIRDILLYDASTESRGGDLGMSLQRLEQELTAGVYISNKQVKIFLKINLLE
uniref:Uncharacterized protein n=1 Tax=Branchiostoma floridae TaxID=7739 RepID=C3YI90_BRAFL|eukprot:XP_002604216.1 hypothetical protein BRAFLDRAFT_73444 [Branchiostoma floridae]